MDIAAQLTEQFIQTLKNNGTQHRPIRETLVQFELELLDSFSESLKAQDESLEMETLECAFLATPLDESRGLLLMDAKLPFKAPDKQVEEVIRFASLVNPRLVWTFMVFHEPENMLTCRVNSPASLNEDMDFLTDSMTGAIAATAMLVLPSLINLLLTQTTAQEAVNRVDAQLARMQDNG